MREPDLSIAREAEIVRYVREEDRIASRRERLRDECYDAWRARRRSYIVLAIALLGCAFAEYQVQGINATLYTRQIEFWPAYVAVVLIAACNIWNASDRYNALVWQSWMMDNEDRYWAWHRKARKNWRGEILSGAHTEYYRTKGPRLIALIEHELS